VWDQRRAEADERTTEQERRVKAIQRKLQLFFADGVACDGNRFNRTVATAPLFTRVAPCESADENLVSQTFASWNDIAGWLRGVDGFRGVA
jgi:hypothetical protein